MNGTAIQKQAQWLARASDAERSGDGVEAIEAGAADPSDILLTDMRMPVMSGEALIWILRQRRPDLPIVVTAGYSEHLPEEEPGRLVVLRKPYSMSALVPAIIGLLSSRTGPES